MRYDAVIFDLDGTLVDTLEDIGDAMNRVLAAEEAPVHGYDAYRYLVGRGLWNLAEQALPSERRDEVTVRRCYDRMVADYSAHSLVRTRPYEGIVELLDGLEDADVPLAVFSNKSHDLTVRIVEALLGPARFRQVRGAVPGVPLKPDPAVALDLAAGLGVAPALVAYVGDSNVDMQTARAAGMPAVGVSWGFRTAAELREHGAAVIIHRPQELLELREA